MPAGQLPLPAIKVPLVALGAPIPTQTAVLLVGRAFVIALSTFLRVAHCWPVAAVGFGAGSQWPYATRCAVPLLAHCQSILDKVQVLELGLGP